MWGVCPAEPQPYVCWIPGTAFGQGGSPEELALVNAARDVGVTLVSVEGDTVVVDVVGSLRTFSVGAVAGFSSPLQVPCSLPSTHAVWYAGLSTAMTHCLVPP